MESQEENEHSLSDEFDHVESVSTKKKVGRFDAVQLAVLHSYYNSGMTGTGERHSLLITQASKETKLTEEQVKRWIKKKNMRQKHARQSPEQPPTSKRVKLTSWQQHLKEFGDTEVGKSAMREGAGFFNKTASRVYHNLSHEEKQQLRDRCTLKESQLSTRELKNSGAKIFKKIQKQFKALEHLGYSAICFGFFEEDIQCVTTSNATNCINPSFIEYIYAVIIAANPPNLLSMMASVPVQSSMGNASSTNSIGVNHSAHSAKVNTSLSKSKTQKVEPTKAPLPSTSKQQQLHPPSSSKTPLPFSAATVAIHPSTSISDSMHASSPTTSAIHISSVTTDSIHSSSATTDPICSSSVIIQPSSPNTNSTQSCDLPPSASVLPTPGQSQVEPPDKAIVISSSPVKSDPNLWIPQLGLFFHDKAVLESVQWLNDNIIFAAQSLLHKQTKGKVFGWQSTQCQKREGLFHPIPSRSSFVQLLHVAASHWVVASNIDIRGGYYSDTVCIYDSERSLSISSSTKRIICSFVKVVSDAIRFDLINVQGQPNSYDCGVFALACATELAHGTDPVLCRWDGERMRQHLIQCLESGYLTHFPTLGKRRVPLGMRVRKSIVEDIYCVCRMPNDLTRAMIKCKNCKKWYHNDCMSLDLDKTYSETKWVCSVCEDILKEVSK